MTRFMLRVLAVILVYWVIKNFEWSLLTVVMLPLFVIVFGCIIFGKGEVGASDSPSRSCDKSSNNRPKTVSSQPFTWQQDKTWVPGHGYRDAQGNYYDYNGAPKAQPVDIKDK